MIQFPKISIITPSYNQAAFLEETICSVLGQCYPNLEYIVIDGGSSDGSVEIIKKYETKLTYWVSEPDQGQSHAINKGFAQATGDVITWLNSDDVLVAGALNRVAKRFAENENLGVLHGNTILFGSKMTSIIRTSSDDLPGAYFAGMAFPQPSSFFSRNVLNHVGPLNGKFHYGMDYDFFLRAACTFQFLSVNETFSKYRLHPQSKTSTSASKFARDWRVVFCAFLKGIPNGEKYLDTLETLNLQEEAVPMIIDPLPKVYSLDDIFDLFLLNQIIFLYDALEIQQVAKITSYLKNYRYHFFSKHNLNQVHLRSTYLPSSLINFFRMLRTV